MSPAATEDPIAAIYPIPGELDEGEKGHPALPPIPVRLERSEAEKAVRRGAFSFTDPSFDEREAAAKAPAAALVAGEAKLDAKGTKAVAEAQEAAAAAGARADALEARLAALEAAATPPAG